MTRGEMDRYQEIKKEMEGSRAYDTQLRKASIQMLGQCVDGDQLEVVRDLWKSIYATHREAHYKAIQRQQVEKNKERNKLSINLEGRNA